MTSAQSDLALQRVVHFYETLTVESTEQLDQIYAADAFFKDPFNEVNGVAAIRMIFAHMFEQVDAPRFVVTLQMGEGNDAFMTWEFHFSMKRFSRDRQCIRGATQLKFDANGLVSYHRDYWDAAEELYEKLPLLGTLMRWLKRSANQR